jgi:1-acyl-sn-glycerol-3-phosphate acyltransferase
VSDAFYKVVREIGRPAFWCSSSPLVRGAEHIPARGACILAANHCSPYDVPLLMRHVPRHIDFVSIVEVFRNPLVAWFYGSMNAFPLDRSRSDAPTVRIMLDRLARGRLLCMFPEGGFRRGDRSVLRDGKIVPGVGRLALLAGAPIVPVVIVNSAAYSRLASWLPLRSTMYGVAFGAPIPPDDDPARAERVLVEQLRVMHAGLTLQLPEHCRVL